MTKLRVGLIGFGAWGRFHAAAIDKAEGAELAAVAARSAETCAEAQALYSDALVTTDVDQVLHDDSIELVVIVLPSDLHFQVTSAALRAGKHVLLEKPMCLQLAECDALLQLAASEQRQLAIGHELRLSSLWGQVKAMIDEGFVGEPQYVLVELSRNPYRPGADGWRYDIDRVGNWILEEPIHFFDFARWYLTSAGEPVSVYARANSKQPGHPELQDNFSAVLNFSGGAYAVVSQTLAAFEHHQTVKVTGTKGALWASWSGAMDRTLHPRFELRGFDGTQVIDIPIEKITGEVYELHDQIAMMVQAVLAGAPLSCSGWDGRQSVAMCLAAQESVETGLPVFLPPPASA